LVLGEATLAVASEALKRACGLFAAGDPSSSDRVPLGLFRSFLEAVKGNDIQITNENVSGLSQLCEEFDFPILSTKLSAFRDSPSFRDSADAEAQSRISALEERDSQQERRLAALEATQSQLAHLPAKLARMQADLARVSAEVRAGLPQLRAFAEAALRGS
jgi:uncharacterized coiled-coil protein SlyX